MSTRSLFLLFRPMYLRSPAVASMAFLKKMEPYKESSKEILKEYRKVTFRLQGILRGVLVGFCGQVLIISLYKIEKKKPAEGSRRFSRDVGFRVEGLRF